MTDLTHEEIHAQLAKITTSSDFAAGPRVKKFLAHLVTEELEGRGGLLKGTALAMDVFGRGGDFDPNNDPVVRIEAVKLRKALEYYYLTAGAQDGLLITIPKGQYRPDFLRSSPKKETIRSREQNALPTIGVMAFTGSETARAMVYRHGLPEEVSLELSRFGQLRVLSGWKELADGSHAEMPPRQVPPCDYALTGTVRDVDDRIRVTVQLLRQPEGVLVWSERFDIAKGTENAFDVQEKIARQCAIRVADAYGVVAEDVGARYSGREAADASVYEALLAFHAQMRTSRTDSLHEFLDLANGAIRDNPQSGLAHALVALGCIEQVVMGEARISEIMDHGSRHAEQAVSLAPHCQEALFAVAVFALLNRDEHRFIRMVQAAVGANPNGSLMIAMAGAWITMFGDVERGSDLIHKAIKDNPVLPVWTSIALCIRDISQGDYLEASSKVKNIDARDCAGDWIMIAAAHALAGNTELAVSAFEKGTSYGIDVNSYLTELPLPEEIASKLRSGISSLI